MRSLLPAAIRRRFAAMFAYNPGFFAITLWSLPKVAGNLAPKT